MDLGSPLAAAATGRGRPSIEEDETGLMDMSTDLLREVANLHPDEEGRVDVERINMLEDKEESKQNNEKENQEEEIETNFGLRLGQVRKMKMNKLIKQYLLAVGKEMMDKMNIPKLCNHVLARKKREQKALCDDLFDYLESKRKETNPEGKVKLDESGMAAPNFRKYVLPSYRFSN